MNELMDELDDEPEVIYHCPKCGSVLDDEDWPVTVCTESGNTWMDVETLYYCRHCDRDWTRYEVPEDPLYDGGTDD